MRNSKFTVSRPKKIKIKIIHYLLEDEEIWLKSVCRWFNHSKGWGFVNLGKLFVFVLLSISIRDGNPSNFKVGQKSLKKNPDFSHIADSWNFSKLWIFGLQIL